MSLAHANRWGIGVLVPIACSVMLACGELTPVTTSRAPRACRTVPGPSPSQCRLSGSDADWLPPAYASNANCRCQATPSSPSANCVRGKLDAILVEVPETTRTEWQHQRAELYDTGRHEEYDLWLRQTAGREIYRWHQLAHASCCCPAPLPPYEQWSSTLTVPFEDCSRTRAIAEFGSCRGQPGRW
ncbi:MAG: hypothetical protein JRH16_14080 [Deltaproteobacteria bacterium]|nr:hypothetical protein [Deltaproteobacteria bacterium]MBW2359751.1 hypothetical protein [Deltaproteobacteria bacterium]